MQAERGDSVRRRELPPRENRLHDLEIRTRLFAEPKRGRQLASTAMLDRAKTALEKVQTNGRHRVALDVRQGKVHPHQGSASARRC